MGEIGITWQILVQLCDQFRRASAIQNDQTAQIGGVVNRINQWCPGQLFIGSTRDQHHWLADCLQRRGGGSWGGGGGVVDKHHASQFAHLFHPMFHAAKRLDSAADRGLGCAIRLGERSGGGDIAGVVCAAQAAGRPAIVGAKQGDATRREIGPTARQRIVGGQNRQISGRLMQENLLFGLPIFCQRCVTVQMIGR